MGRGLLLILYLVGGFLLGDIAAWGLLIPAALVGHIQQGSVDTFTLFGGVIGALMGLGAWRKGAAPASASRAHGSARWADAREVRALVRAEGLIIGRENRRGGRLLHYGGEQHLITIAPTRSGKGVGVLIPNLLTADRSILCVDPKGENARVTARVREMFGPVYVLDPFGVSGRATSAYNPLDRLNAESLDLAEDVALLAEALVHDPPGQTGEAHWNEEAKALIAGLILHVVCHEPSHRRNLPVARELLTASPSEFAALLRAMQASPCAGGLVARAANRHLGKAEREAAGVLSSAQRHTHFLDSRRMASVLDHSSFRFDDLKRRLCTVFLVLPPERLVTHSRWLRLLVAEAISALASSQTRPEKPVLLLLDEFAALGRLEALEQAFGLMAGYGLQLWPILQDLHQLRSVYGERAGTFLSNAGLIQMFNVGDVETASWLAKSLGAATLAYRTAGSSRSQSPGRYMLSQTSTSDSTADHLIRRELLTPDEIMRLDGTLEILLRQGAAPVVARKLRYYEDAEFGGRF